MKPHLIKDVLFAMFEPLLMTHWSLTLLMTGIIWFVQIVHYPLFRTIPPASAASDPAGVVSLPAR